MTFGSLTRGELAGERVISSRQATLGVPKAHERRKPSVVQGAMGFNHGSLEFRVYGGWPFSRIGLGGRLRASSTEATTGTTTISPCRPGCPSV
jgi:hypothetical protein